jgi:leucyl aminopeptidase
VAAALPGGRLTARARAQAVAEGALLGLYTFDRYKARKAEERAVETLTLVVDRRDLAAAREGVRVGELTAEATAFARDLINEPANSVTATVLAEEAEKIAKAGGLRVRVYDRAACEKMGMGAFMGVNRGSQEPPRFIHLTYTPKGHSRRRVTLIGKGITFDSGGLSLKPGDRMWEMKGDMAGAAAVLYTMRALGRLRPSVKVVGILCCAENLPDGNAQRPGDIFTAKNGKSIMVDNTDAEGRLVLTDGLARAGEEGATHVVDIATLTGAVVRALGPSIAGVMGTDRELVRRIQRSGENQGETFWELPLVEEYRESLKTPYADLNNIASGGLAGAITAALFLREFVPEKAAWAHLDIAGPMFKDKEWKYYEAGAIGFGVKTLVDLCERFREPLTDHS